MRVLSTALSFGLFFFYPITSHALFNGDLDCNKTVNVVDVQLAILNALDAPLSSLIDEDGNGIHDGCDASLEELCEPGTVLTSEQTCTLDPDAIAEAYNSGYDQGLKDASPSCGPGTIASSNGDCVPDPAILKQNFDAGTAACLEAPESCENMSDIAILGSLTLGEWETIFASCASDCADFNGELNICMAICYGEETELSPTCSWCHAEEASCVITHCAVKCLEGLFSTDCQDCANNFGCNDNLFFCGECAPNCIGLECGPDGCGQDCGICDANSTCEAGTCVANSGENDVEEDTTDEEDTSSCDPQCSNKECGADGCEGLCGICDVGFECVEGLCHKEEDDTDVIEDTVDEEDTSSCNPQCSNKECGPDGCEGLCGICDDGFECDEGLCVTPECLTNSDCLKAEYCGAGNICVDKKDKGDSCLFDFECFSASCTSGGFGLMGVCE